MHRPLGFLLTYLVACVPLGSPCKTDWDCGMTLNICWGGRCNPRAPGEPRESGVEMDEGGLDAAEEEAGDGG